MTPANDMKLETEWGRRQVYQPQETKITNEKMCLNAHFEYFHVDDVTWFISTAMNDGMKWNVMMAQSKMDSLAGLINPAQIIHWICT